MSAFFRHTEILGIGLHPLTTVSENLVAFPESFHILAYGFNFPGELAPHYSDLWPSQAKIYPREKQEEKGHVEFSGGDIAEMAGRDVPVIDGRRIYSDQDFIVLGRWLFCVFELKDIRRPKFCVDDRFHEDAFNSLSLISLFHSDDHLSTGMALLQMQKSFGGFA